MKNPQTALPIKTPFYYGWVITSVSALAIFFSGPGQTYSFSTFVDPLLHEFGWSRSLISSIYSGGTLLAGLMLYMMGYLVDRVGCRFMLTFITLVLAGSCFFMSAVSGPATLFLSIVMLRFAGPGSLSLIPSVLIPQWFYRKRGRAFWVVSLGAVVCAALFPPMNVALIRLWGWRHVWWFWGILLVTVLAPLAWLLIRNRPEEVGMLPDNEPREGLGTSGPAFQERSWSLAQVIRLSSFWIIVITTAIPPLVLTGLNFHHFSIMAENGLSVEAATGVFTVVAVVQFVTLAPVSWAADRFDNRFLLSITLLLLALSTVLVFYTVNPVMAVLLGSMRGLTVGCYDIVINTIWPNYYGRTFLARIRSLSLVAISTGAASGPLPFGIAFDYFSGYREIIMIMSGISFLAAGITLSVRPPVHPSRQSTNA